MHKGMIKGKFFEYDWSHKKWIIKAIGVNILVLFALLLAFEPTPKSDDYDQVMIANGGFTGEYSSYLPYCNFLFSKLNQILYTLLPNIPWYYILQYLLVFVSLTVITGIFARKDKKYREVVVFIVLLLCGYELYIRFTFTKVAGIVIISGFVVLLNLILNEQKKMMKYFFPCLLIIIGMTVRSSMYLLIAGVFGSAFVIFLIETKKINKHTFKQAARFVILVLLLYLCNIGLSKFHMYMISQDEAWNTWHQANTVRARLQDYDMANYGDYKEEYLAIGISNNDYNTWRGQSIYIDKDFFSFERLKDIADIKPIRERKSIVQILSSAFRGSLSYYFEDTGIYIFLIAAIMLFMVGGIDSLKYIITVFSFCFFAYLYMNYQGRLQHHVDVCVLIAGSFLLLYYSYRFEGTTSQEENRRYILIYGIVIFLIMTFYNDISSSSYYGDYYGKIASQKIQQKKNKEIFDVLSKDKEHYYLFAAVNTDLIYDNIWGMFQKVELGYYSNIGISNRYYFPNTEKTLENYGINNIMAESVNSKVIYFATTVNNLDYIEFITTYIQEHYNEKAECVLVKQVGEVNVYSVVTP